MWDDDQQKARILEAVGLSAEEERAYTLLIGHPGLTATDVATQLQVTRNRARDTLNSLVHNGLVTPTPDRAPRYLPTPVEIAVEALISQRQRDLERARKAAARLSRKASTSRQRADTELAETISGAAAITAQIDQLLGEADHEVMVMIRPPSRPEAVTGSEFGLAALQRGVVLRTLYDRATLTDVACVEQLARTITAGERPRVVSAVPAPMLIVDQRAGLVPFDPDDPEGSWLLVRASSLLEVFVSLFEHLWDRAAPFRISAQGELNVDNTTVEDPQERQLLIELLAAGLRDDAISSHLDLSIRTIDRRVRSLMETLGANTRFQAGWLAAHQVMGKPRPRRRRKPKAS